MPDAPASAALIEPPRIAIHFQGGVGTGYCGAPGQGGNTTTDPQHVSCSTCLSLMARVDPLLLLAADEATLIRRLRLLRTNGDYAMLVSVPEGHLHINRVLIARAPH